MSKTLKWLLGILIAIVLISLSVLGGIYFTQKLKKESSPTSPTATDENTNEGTTTSEEQAQNGAGWKIFKNFAQSYLIEYPDDATVENGSSSEGEKDIPANKAVCVKISTEYYHVIIASRLITNDINCLNTGFGTEWSNVPDETITAAGPQYTVSGMKFESASLGTYEDLYSFTTLSGEKIEYGISVNEKYDSAMTKAQTKDIVHKMVSSFSPAE